ncbi:unnamed protein product [Rotaria sp. Silwood1]|nr:unnamed protein product [Rotaria sp. Silwood1]CAF1412670.1 unnamed protein product [Rotaria sp. Silwood1]
MVAESFTFFEMVETDDIERWAIAVIREPFLLRQFCIDTQFPRTRQEEEELEMERHLAEDLLKCDKCSCVHHDGFVYDNEVADLTIYTPSEVATLYRKLELKIIKHPDRCEGFEHQTT